MKPTACHWGLLLVCVFWILPATADISGRCGDNASWKYHSSDKTLVISGTGSITHGGWNAWSSETTQELISYGQDSIRYVIVEKGITQIGDKTFSNLFQAVAFFLPEGLTSIGNGAFSQCYAAVDIKLPSSLKTISDNAFWDCYSLTGMTIPASVESIGDWVFHGCRSLRYLQVETGNRFYDSRAGCQAIIETASNILWAGCQNTIIPSSVVGIRKDAFQAKRFSNIEIPSSVTEIGEYAFFDCTELTSVSIPRTVESIGDCAFCGCVKLDTVRVEWNTPPTITSGTFYRSAKKILLVPGGCKEAYENALYWRDFKYIVEESTPVGLLPLPDGDGSDRPHRIYDMNGKPVPEAARTLAPGFYIIRGQKILIR